MNTSTGLRLAGDGTLSLDLASELGPGALAQSLYQRLNNAVTYVESDRAPGDSDDSTVGTVWIDTDASQAYLQVGLSIPPIWQEITGSGGGIGEGDVFFGSTASEFDFSENETFFQYGWFDASQNSFFLGEFVADGFMGRIADGSTVTYAQLGENSLTVGPKSVASADNAVALGGQTHAAGVNSIAVGGGTLASGNSSFASGAASEANGAYSFSTGFFSEANGSTSAVFGTFNNVAGDNSLVGGSSSSASGNRAIAFGIDVQANADYSAVFGSNNDSTGAASLMSGQDNLATGPYTLVTGINNAAHDYAETALGSSALASSGSTTTLSGNPGNTLLKVGNGVGSSRSDALRLLASGDMTIAGTLTQSSDRRLKTNIRTITHALETVTRMRGVSFDWTSESRRSSKAQIGFVAQEVQEILPELVTQPTPESPLAMSYGNVTAVLVEAVKQQQAHIESLEERITRLEALVSSSD